ncbi:MAG TPA: alkaline phosphatase family protein [Cellulomonas sp.]
MMNRRRLFGLSAAVVTGLATVGAIAVPAVANPGWGGPHPGQTTITSTGLQPGQIKHVWLIILENKSYDATFTGLNQNSYLWKTLPSQGALLKDYYGTGHYSQDNYTSMVSGQGPSTDVQSDCDVAYKDLGTATSVITQHIDNAGHVLPQSQWFGQNDNYGQVISPAGPNAADGANGCVFASDVPTMFDQFDAAGVSWKGYAQDLGGQAGREDPAKAGAPLDGTLGESMKPTAAQQAAGITSLTGAQANDQYVAKHFPFPWFHSITDDPADTDANHIANLDDATSGLLADLKKPAAQVPAFNWITPNNCSDAHDATCVGNNLSGLFDANGNPNYSLPLTTAPVNHTGGLYAADLFLSYYIPLIEKSAAFKDGGLIDITFDEANPPFTNMSFNNATDNDSIAQAAAKSELYRYTAPTAKDAAAESKSYPAHTFPSPGPMAKDYIDADAAGENINGKNVSWEPTGPNTPLETDAHGNQLFPGPGNNGYITRPPSCDDPKDAALVNADASNCVQGERLSNASFAGAKTITASATIGQNTLIGPVTVTDIGRGVTGSGIPAGAYIGTVINNGPVMVSASSQPVTVSSFTLVDAKGRPLVATGPVTAVTLSAQGIPGHLTAGQTPLDTFDAQDAAPGGGITGSVLISPYIRPGTVSTTNYNHYSWLRTMEDIFQVSTGTSTAPIANGAGSVSGGLDNKGHLGFAAQSGLMPFGPDVFTAAGNGRH